MTNSRYPTKSELYYDQVHSRVVNDSMLNGELDEKLFVTNMLEAFAEELDHIEKNAEQLKINRRGRCAAMCLQGLLANTSLINPGTIADSETLPSAIYLSISIADMLIKRLEE